ncbi:hypothetical protein METY_1513 [Methylopila sp. Yamaguchi]|nr:hypothetical protein METY_1513 [Methylopila sp. Yamaguchi]
MGEDHLDPVALRLLARRDAHGDAGETIEGHRDPHRYAPNHPVHHDAPGFERHAPFAPIRRGVRRRETDRKREGIEPVGRPRSDARLRAGLGLTSHCSVSLKAHLFELFVCY